MATDGMTKKSFENCPVEEEMNIALPGITHETNASGYSDQLSRQYGLVGLTGTAITVNNAWVVLGSSISVSLRK